MPASMAWNMVVDPTATGLRPTLDASALWDNYAWFLERILPVAEAAGVAMAAHPDDPPLETVRRQPRLVWRPELYQRLLDLSPSAAHRLELCVGTVAEMASGEAHEAVAQYAGQGRIGYVHLRNVRGRVPQYCQTFPDEGDVDVARIIRILRNAGFDGVVIPDHAADGVRRPVARRHGVRDGLSERVDPGGLVGARAG